MNLYTLYIFFIIRKSGHSDAFSDGKYFYIARKES